MTEHEKKFEDQPAAKKADDVKGTKSASKAPAQESNDLDFDDLFSVFKK